jgi:hypothetical protein
VAETIVSPDETGANDRTMNVERCDQHNSTEDLHLGSRFCRSLIFEIFKISKFFDNKRQETTNWKQRITHQQQQQQKDG